MHTPLLLSVCGWGTAKSKKWFFSCCGSIPDQIFYSSNDLKKSLVWVKILGLTWDHSKHESSFGKQEVRLVRDATADSGKEETWSYCWSSFNRGIHRLQVHALCIFVLSLKSKLNRTTRNSGLQWNSPDSRVAHRVSHAPGKSDKHWQHQNTKPGRLDHSC